MKKILCLMLILSILISLVSCAASAPNKNDGLIINGISSGLQIDGISAGGSAGKNTVGDSNNDESSTSDGVEAELPFENPFVLTQDEPTSTFSADVDTASYTYFRKLVEASYNLQEIISTAGKSIRTEEMINYFDYNYQTPGEHELFSKTVTMAQSPWNDQSQLLVIGLQAQEAAIASKNNLVFLIDVSGSMHSQDKLPLLQKAFSYLVDNLNEDDVVSIVTYSGKETVVLDGCSGSKKELIMNAINSLRKYKIN
jgi:hypothetical protein